MYFLLAGDKRALLRYARNRRGSVALCIGMRVMRGSMWRLAIDEVWPEKVQGWRKGAGSKIAVGPPIPIYIASDRIPSQHVGVGLAQARPNEFSLQAKCEFMIRS